MGHGHSSGGVLMLDTLAANSGLRNVSPGLKTAFSVLVLLLCVGASDAVVGTAVALSMILAMVFLGKTPAARVAALLRIPLLFLLVSCLVILLEVCREELCAQDELNCGRFFAACERFCAAEDMLFLAVEDGGTERACYAAQGLGVLTKMAALPRETLILGGLPYEEVTQAIDDIRRIGGL